jgi:hypothetical protein
MMFTDSPNFGRSRSTPSGPEEASRPLVIESSSLYREFIAEREEILRLKWIESEKAGRDIGFDAALLRWVLRHRTDWRVARRAS